MDQSRRYGCLLAFLALCFLTVFLLQGFTSSEPAFSFLSWREATVQDGQGISQPYSLDYEQGYAPLEPGLTYTFRATIDQLPSDGYLLVETGNWELSVCLAGEELYTSNTSTEDDALFTAQAHIPLPPQSSGQELILTVTPHAALTQPLSPPRPRLTSNFLLDKSALADAYYYALPVGGFALGFLLVCGLFLIGLYFRHPDRSLPLLALALAAFAINQLALGVGYYFLPKPLYHLLIGGWLELLPSLLMLIYLALNRSRSFWLYLGRVSACSGVALLVAYLLAWAFGWRMFNYTNSLCTELFLHGQWRPLVLWLTRYLSAACALISAYALARSIAQARAEAQALAVKNELVMDSYRAIEQGTQKTYALRHELKNHVITMNLLLKQGDLAGLERYLTELDNLQTGLTPMRFTEHVLVNAILQNAMAQAEQRGIHFKAALGLPAEVGVEDGDLCRLLMNMLDNALQAAAQVPDPEQRFVRFHAELRNGFLTINCQNSYTGALKLDERGCPQTTKEDKQAHGFGLRQMREVAEKYQSILDLSYAENVFTVLTALRTR